MNDSSAIRTMRSCLFLATAFILMLLLSQYTPVVLVHPGVAIIGFSVTFCFFCMGLLNHHYPNLYGSKCPHCQSDTFYGQIERVGVDKAYREVFCDGCDDCVGKEELTVTGFLKKEIR